MNEEFFDIRESPDIKYYFNYTDLLSYFSIDILYFIEGTVSSKEAIIFNNWKVYESKTYTQYT